MDEARDVLLDVVFGACGAESIDGDSVTVGALFYLHAVFSTVTHVHLTNAFFYLCFTQYVVKNIDNFLYIVYVYQHLSHTQEVFHGPRQNYFC